MMDNAGPSVSVIIPTFNRASLLKRSIESVLCQSYQDFEIIVVDDASTDKTDEVVRNLNDPRIRYIKHEENRGGSAARNTGIKAALGKFIAFQDSDDVWLSDKLAKQMALFEDSPPDIGIVYTQCVRWEGDLIRNIPDEHQKLKDGALCHALLNENFIALPTVVIKATCFEKVGKFDETLPRLQDWELFIRIAKSYKFCYIPEPLVHSFFTKGCISSQSNAVIEAWEILLSKHSQEFKADKGLYLAKLLDLANLYRLEKNILFCRKYLIAAFKLNHQLSLVLAISASYFGIGFFDYCLNLMNGSEKTK